MDITLSNGIGGPVAGIVVSNTNGIPSQKPGFARWATAVENIGQQPASFNELGDLLIQQIGALLSRNDYNNFRLTNKMCALNNPSHQEMQDKLDKAEVRGGLKKQFVQHIRREVSDNMTDSIKQAILSISVEHNEIGHFTLASLTYNTHQIVEQARLHSLLLNMQKMQKDNASLEPGRFSTLTFSYAAKTVRIYFPEIIKLNQIESVFSSAKQLSGPYSGSEKLLVACLMSRLKDYWCEKYQGQKEAINACVAAYQSLFILGEEAHKLANSAAER